jgi:hypothetical protein
MKRISSQSCAVAIALSAAMLLAPVALADDPTNPGGGQEPPDGDPGTAPIGPTVLTDAVTRIVSILPTLFVL